ncbi:hypothetical protein DSO57_1027956 [Entomophthora muscae]|uniref:Uncharacterized protein n=1 Tax=Entomophthora muscae TaxID=34485 RepID=A0ACC2TCT1_9FUNG|nr:hypothetical protein DSO57_1027956 [Entomophthora muscae]
MVPKRTAGSKPDLSELEVLVEKAILQKRAGANKSQRPDGSSPHILNGSKPQAISIQSCPTIQVTDNVSDLIFTNSHDLFNHLPVSSTTFPSTTNEIAPPKITQVRPENSGENGQSGSYKRPRPNTALDKDEEIKRLNKSIAELKSQVSTLTRSVDQTNEAMNQLLLENQTTCAQFLSVIKELIQRAAL